MPEILLRTKLSVPPLRASMVSRPQLIERLNQGLQLGRKLTLISAPAGFGKTTLASSWIQTMGEDMSSPIAWLSLDDGDNDPTQFLTYFIAALIQADAIDVKLGSGMQNMLQSPQPPPSDGILTTLINEISSNPDRMVFFLDDYHQIQAQPIHEALTFLLEHLPTQMHLVIVTREDPHLPLARLRARGQLSELRANDLRFTTAEAAEFLNQVMGLSLSAEDIAMLETRTEGWITGLQLAAISMQSSQDVKAFIQSFAGSHRFVLDYLIEDVLEQQPESVQTFVLHTAILDRLTGSLCDALTGQEDGQRTLEYLERANLFILPLDNERRWYRYHHLFSDLLRQRLRQTQLDSAPTLHHRACEWHEQNGFVNEAIEYALRAEDFERAVDLIEKQADKIWQRGEHAKMQSWFDRLPIEVIYSKTQLCIFRAYYLLASGQHETGENLLNEVEKVLESATDHSTTNLPVEKKQIAESERKKLLGRVAAVRAFIHSDHGNVPEIFRHARKALEYLPKQDLTWRNLTADTLADAYSIKGDLGAAYKARLEALEMSEAAGNVHYIIVSNLKLASTLRYQGRLQRTLEICQQQWQLANQYGLTNTNIVGCILAIWGDILAEINDLNGAIQQAKKGVELTEHGWNLTIHGYSSLCLIRVLFSRGDLNGAEEIIQKMEKTAQEFGVPPWVLNQMAVWQVRIWLVQDELEAASQWMEKRKLFADGKLIPLREMNFYSLIEYIMVARILIAESRLDEAARLLQYLLSPADAGGQTTRLIENLTLQAMILQAKGDTTQALSLLEQAFNLSEPEGFIRIFVDEGPKLARLLYEALSKEIAPEYVQRLLAAFPANEPEQMHRNQMQSHESEWIEPLSDRELEVLHLVAEGFTRQEIAAKLVLSLNTVKTHARNIYSKLGVTNQMQAVGKARALGILELE